MLSLFDKWGYKIGLWRRWTESNIVLCVVEKSALGPTEVTICFKLRQSVKVLRCWNGMGDKVYLRYITAVAMEI